MGMDLTIFGIAEQELPMTLRHPSLDPGTMRQYSNNVKSKKKLTLTSDLYTKIIFQQILHSKMH